MRGDVHTNWSKASSGCFGVGWTVFTIVSHKHLHRYLSEFEFRHNHRHVSDGERARLAIRAANHKRLTYAEQIGDGRMTKVCERQDSNLHERPRAPREGNQRLMFGGFQSRCVYRFRHARYD